MQNIYYIILFAPKALIVTWQRPRDTGAHTVTNWAVLDSLKNIWCPSLNRSRFLKKTLDEYDQRKILWTYFLGVHSTSGSIWSAELQIFCIFIPLDLISCLPILKRFCKGISQGVRFLVQLQIWEWPQTFVTYSQKSSFKMIRGKSIDIMRKSNCFR